MFLFPACKLMPNKKNFDELPESQKNLSLRIFDLITGRVLKRAYLNLDEKTRDDMDRIFASENDEEKEDFIKKNIPGFNNIFEEESKKIEAEIKTEIEKEV